MFRKTLGVVGNLPGLALVIFGPIVGLLQGHLKYPEVLISHLMAAPAYKGVFGVVSVSTSASNIYLWIEVLRHMRAKSPDKLHSSIDIMLGFLVFGVFGGNLLVLFFNFEEIGGEGWGLESFLHCAGAAIVFASIAGTGFVYMFFCASTLDKLGVVPKEDAWYRKVACILVCLLAAVGAIVRPFHLADPHAWGWAMLAVEVLFCLVGILATILGNLQTLTEMDLKDPVGFAARPAGKKQRPARKKD